MFRQLFPHYVGPARTGEDERAVSWSFLNHFLPTGVSRRLAAVLYADVVRYSRLTEADEEGTHQRLMRYMDIVAACIRRHHGRVAHYAGDAVPAAFDNARRDLYLGIRPGNDRQPAPCGLRLARTAAGGEHQRTCPCLLRGL